MFKLYFACFFAFSFFSVANSSDRPEKLKFLEERIATLNSNLSCKKQNDCVALPVGNNPCGGPQRYIVASKNNEKFNKLKSVIEEHIEAERKWQKQAGIGGGCVIANKPNLKCQKMKCTKSTVNK